MELVIIAAYGCLLSLSSSTRPVFFGPEFFGPRPHSVFLRATRDDKQHYSRKNEDSHALSTLYFAWSASRKPIYIDFARILYCGHRVLRAVCAVGTSSVAAGRLAEK